MSGSLLGASGLGPRKPGTPAPAPPPEQTDAQIPPDAPEEQYAGAGKQREPTGPTGPTGEGTQSPIAKPSGAAEEEQRVTVSRKRKPSRIETEPQTIYFGSGEIDKAGDLAHAFKRTGRFKGLVRGHVGVSLVMRTALDLLLEEQKRDPDAALDRAIRVASRGVR